ncbi:hypothetical protein VNI00_010032 [Paramarasmius palmivorus]|uniref:Cytochrome P450 n=1 Tax=Paramarasmius palmivorus TaxID=297713 RepID=A0AAW0CKP9_9AGAR
MTWLIPAVLIIAVASAWLLQLGKRESYLPPGPPTLPLIGNIHNLPTSYLHYRFTEWARKYGGIFSLKIGSQTLIVLNTMEHVKELLDRRNAATAGRPQLHVADMITKGRYFVFMQPGTVPPVDKLPILGYIPERWAPWKALLKEVQRKHHELYFGFFEECERRMMTDNDSEGSSGSLVEELLRQTQEHGMDRDTLVYLGAVLIEAGAETTSSLLKSLVLFLVASPEAQNKAYEEVVRVVDAILKEVQRLRPVAPLGVPHATTTTEEYLGYTIPENTTIFPNVYAINHDPEFFEDPESFRPERYLTTEHGTKPGVDDRAFRADIGFGFGRRACPGMYLARNSLMLVAMNLIWAFEFKPLLDPKTGSIIPVDLDAYEEGLSFTPKSFQCRINPRSESAVDIIEHQYREAAETFVKYERDLAPEDKEWVRESRRDW